MTDLTMSQLKKLSKTPAVGNAFRLAVIGDCATQHISTAIRGMGIAKGINIEVFDADYNQIIAQTSDPDSETYSFSPDAVLLFMCTEKLFEKFVSVPLSERNGFAEAAFDEIRGYVSSVRKNCRAHIILTLFAEYDDRVCGNFGARNRQSFVYQLRKLNLLLCDEAERDGDIFTLDTQFIHNKIGMNISRSSRLYAIAKMPFTTEAVPALAEEIVSIICAMRGMIKKCIVLDLDNTLWGGVVGDVGFDGIEIGEYGTGHAFTAFQTWLKELKNRGILLAVCSKNDEDKAKEPFEKHPDMVLRLEDFAAFVANWENKADNIRAIRNALNIGMDSLVFIDDNPFERGVVRSLIPEITVPEMPEDPADYVDFLRGEALFETVAYSAEDAKRTDMYRAEAGRAAAASACASYTDYLTGLEMKSEAKSFTKFWYPRIAQLSQRSNQFNLRTVRYTEADIERIAEDGKYVTVYFTLNDRFGDYGLISAVIMEDIGDKTLFVDTWIMSCRVLKRTMEEFIVNKMISEAKRLGYEKVIGEYIRTPKNNMVSDIYSREGFAQLSETRFSADVNGFSENTTYITEA